MATVIPLENKIPKPSVDGNHIMFENRLLLMSSHSFYAV